jgi:hypothetical protein
VGWEGNSSAEFTETALPRLEVKASAGALVDEAAPQAILTVIEDY